MREAPGPGAGRGAARAAGIARCLGVWLGLAAVGCGGPGGSADLAGVAPSSLSGTEHFTQAEVEQIIAQAATRAQALGLNVTIAVVDHEGVVLGVLRMGGAAVTTTVSGRGVGGLEGVAVGSDAAAISKAGTGAFFGTQGNAFTTRSAGFIVQEHFPPGIDPSPGGPLFGVQFSNLRCSDVIRDLPAGVATKTLPLGLSADPGGLPLYRNGVAAGGIGVEGDGVYTLDFDPRDDDQQREEVIAAAGTLSFSAPPGIRADQIVVNGLRLPFANAEPPAGQNTTPYATFAAAGTELVAPRTSPASTFVAATVGGVAGSVDPSFFPFIAGTDGLLTAPDVTRIIAQAAQQAERTRAAIRQPLNDKARVSIAVTDTTGAILGVFRTEDAPLFGFDVSVQKARTAVFFSHSQAASDLNAAGLGAYVTAANNDGIALDGSIAFSDTAVGFLSQPIFPPGANPDLPRSNGPFSLPLGTWSIFNTGLQLDLIDLATLQTPPCPAAGTLSKLPNGITIFPGSFPLYKNGQLVGGIGISGDGVEQDNLIGFEGSRGFEAPEGIRADTLIVRGARLPYSVFPRNPNLP